MTQKGANEELTIGEGEFILVYCFDTIVGVREPNYSYACLSLLHAGFQEKLCLGLIGCDLNVIDDGSCE